MNNNDVYRFLTVYSVIFFGRLRPFGVERVRVGLCASYIAAASKWRHPNLFVIAISFVSLIELFFIRFVIESRELRYFQFRKNGARKVSKALYIEVSVNSRWHEQLFNWIEWHNKVDLHWAQFPRLERNVCVRKFCLENCFVQIF